METWDPTYPPAPSVAIFGQCPKCCGWFACDDWFDRTVPLPCCPHGQLAAVKVEMPGSTRCGRRGCRPAKRDVARVSNQLPGPHRPVRGSYRLVRRLATVTGQQCTNLQRPVTAVAPERADA